MLKRNIFLLAALSSALLVNHCKKKPTGREAQQATSEQPLSTGFAVKSAIAIQDTPSVRGKAIGTLPIGNKVAIFATRVPDVKDPEKVFWYKIKYSPLGAAGDKPQMPVEGFIPEREAVVRENFLVFEKRTEVSVYKEVAPDKTEEVREPLSVMATTAVNWRRTPALNGEKIRTLQNGEVLAVLEQSSQSVKADGKHGSWYLLQDAAGGMGYAFGGFLVEGTKGDMTALQDAGFQFLSGWMIATGAGAHVYKVAVGNTRIDIAKEPSFGIDWEKTKGALPADTYVAVDGVTTKGDRLRYRFVVSGHEMGPDRYYYVDKKKVKFVRDFYTVSKAQQHTFDDSLAADLNRYAGGDLNVQCSKTTEFAVGASDAPRRFAAIEAHFGPNESEGEHCFSARRRFIFADLSDEKRVFYETEVKSAEFSDLDGDGVPELVSNEQTRGSWSLDVFALKGKRVAPVLQLASYYEQQEVKIGYAELQNKVLRIQGPYTCTENMGAEEKKLCSEDIAQAKRQLASLKFDTKLPPFPYYGKLENGRFTQIAEPPPTN